MNDSIAETGSIRPRRLAAAGVVTSLVLAATASGFEPAAEANVGVGDPPAADADAHDAAWWLLERPEDASLAWPADSHAVPRVAVGGALRQQWEQYRNFEFGLDPRTEGRDGYHLHRLRLHADVWLEDGLRLHGEIANSTIWGNERPTSPVDQDELYVHAAFVELDLAAIDLGASVDSATLRLGRQEIGFGSARLVSIRGGPNIRRSFDAARLTLESDDLTLDVFGGAEVRVRPGNFDNEPSDDVRFYGVHATLDRAAAGAIDLYWFGLERDRAVFDVGANSERRHSFGARWFGQHGAFDWNVEAVGQIGDVGARSIRAWTVASDVGVRLGSGDHAPRLGLRADVISGGSDAGTLNTFNALFPNNSYFSEAAIFAPANLFDVNPALTLHPSEGVTITFLWDFLWRFDTNDAIYVPPGVPAIAGSATDARFIGHSLSAWLEWRVASRLTAFAAWTHFEAGSAVRGAGGSDIDYALLGLEWSF